MRTPRLAVAAPVLLALLAVLVAGCAGEPPTPPAPTDEATAPDFTADWSGEFRRRLPNGWTLTGCDGDAPLICVRDGEQVLGDLALSRYPADSASAGDEPVTVAEAHARNFLGSFAEDRAAGCQGFVFEPESVHEATVGGVEGVRAGFTLFNSGGEVVERVIVHLAVVDDELWLVQTDAYAAEGGCLPPSETDASFVPEHLAELEQYLDDIVAATPLPT